MGRAVENDEPHHASLEDRDLSARRVVLQQALVLYEQRRSPAALDQAFRAAGAAVAVLRGERAREPADAVEARRVMAELPEFERLVSAAVAQAEHSAHAGACRLWEWFGVGSVPPAWDDGERSGARVIVASACAPLEGRGPVWLRPRLLHLAADRWASLLTSELRGGHEELWQRALGERYGSVRQRYAPRTKRRIGTLSQLVSRDERPLAALQKRIARWVIEGGELDTLPAEVEAAFVQTRTPSQLA